MGVLDDPAEFGRVVAAARGYLGEKKPGFAKLMGRSVPTVTRWEKGDVGSIGATIPQRRQLAERIVDVTGCPPDWFELTDSQSPGGTADLRADLERLGEGLRRLAAQTLESDEAAEFEQWWTTDSRSEEPAPGARNE